MDNLRTSGIDFIGNIPWGTHFCQFYQTQDNIMEIVAPYFKAGLESSEFCIWILPESLSTREAKEALKQSIPEIDLYLEKRQIEIIPYADWYLKGSFAPEKILENLTRKINQILANGYKGLRLSEEAFFQEENSDSFIDYEESLNSVIGKYPVIVLCTYSLEFCGINDAIKIAANHDFSLSKRKGKWEQIRNSRQKNEVECKQSEQALDKERTRLQTIINNIPVAVRETDASGGVLLDNGMLDFIWKGKHKVNSVSDYQEFKA